MNLMLVDHRINLSIKMAGTHLCTWEQRSTVTVKCLIQKYSACPMAETYIYRRMLSRVRILLLHHRASKEIIQWRAFQTRTGCAYVSSFTVFNTIPVKQVN